MSGGFEVVSSYPRPQTAFSLYQATKDMVDSSYYLPQDRAGGIYKHVIEYPGGKLAGAEDFFIGRRSISDRSPRLA